MRRAIVGSVVLSLLGAVYPVPLAVAGPASYTITSIGANSCYSIAYGLNESGAAAVHYQTDGSHAEAARWSDGTLTVLPSLNDSRSSQARAINEAGVVVGESYDGVSGRHALRWTGASATDLGVLTGNYSAAFGINDLGQVAGEGHATSNGINHALMWSGGSVTDLGVLPGGNRSHARGINNAGQVIGDSEFEPDGRYHAVIWQSGAIRDLGTLPGDEYSNGTAINELGHATGRSMGRDDGAGQYAFFWNGWRMEELPLLPGGNFLEAKAINDFDQIVGRGDMNAGSHQVAFLWERSTRQTVDLNTLLPSGSGWQLADAFAINNAGQIAGYGYESNCLRAFLMTPVRGEADTSGFVQADGTALSLDGQPYTFTGLNVYNANNRVHWCWYPFDSESLQQSFAAMGDGAEVVRAWFFQDFATSGGQRSWMAFDETIAAAKAQGKKLIVTLGNHWADCDTEGLKTAAWYQTGYAQQPAALPSSYRDYVAQVVNRYKDERAVLMWELLNEPEVPIHTGDGLCDEATSHAILKSWAADVAGLIKSIDPVHMVSIGLIGSGQCGAQYTDYKALHAVLTVDLCGFHDYSDDLMPGDQWNGLAFRLQQCAELDKPLFIGETGIDPRWLDEATVEARAALFEDKLIAQFDAGVVGEVIWAWNAFESRVDTFDIGPGDPTLEVLLRLSGGAPPDPDADGDGVHDDIDTGDGTFSRTSGPVTTSGAILDAADNEVFVTPDATSDGVRVTVTGGTSEATITVCGFTMRLAPGSEAVVTCGSITLKVVTGVATVVLGDGLATVSVPAGVTATLSESDAGGFQLSNISGGSVTVVVDGVSRTVSAGQTLTFEAWDFVGFADPVNNDGVLNVVKAGRIVPLKWRVLAAAGTPVTDLATATVRVSNLACSAGQGSDQLEETAAGASGLQNLGDGYYQFNWKTPKNYGNSCKTLRLDLGDGVEHTALFRFEK